jgi:putative MATE family efflux protein
MEQEKAQIRSKIFSMILPITAENILQTTASFISMAMIGRIDALSVSAIGISSRITQLVWALFKGVTTGATVYVSQAYGAGDSKRLKSIVKETFILCMLIVLILQQFIFWNTTRLLSFFKPEPLLLEGGSMYLRIVSIGLPFQVIVLLVAGILQGMGNAKTPMYIAFLMNLLNIGVGYFLIFGGVGLTALGLKGAAIGLVAAQVIAALIGLFVLSRKYNVLSFKNSSISSNIELGNAIKVFKVGLPSSLESVFWQISALILTRVILSYGTKVLTAYQLGLQAESISFTPASGFAVAATAFIGQALGSGKGEKGKLYIKELLKGTLIITFVCTLVLLLLPKQIMGLLINDKEVIPIGATYLFFMGLVQFPQNIYGLLNGALRGAGYSNVPMWVAGIGIWVIRIPFVLIVTYILHLGIQFIWIGFCADLIVRFIISLLIYKRKNIYNAVPLVEKTLE